MKWKKSIVTLLALAMLLSGISLTAFAETEAAPAGSETAADFDAPVIEPMAANLTMAQYDTKVSAFTADSRWKNGTAWTQIPPKLSTWSSAGCCAYCADFAAYVYGSGAKVWTDTTKFSKYTNPNEIRSGDIIYIDGPHWFVVLYRRGNDLYTAEGSYSNKVRINSKGYYIKNGALYQNNTWGDSKKSISAGYHYKFSDIANIRPNFTNHTPSVTANAATLSMTLNKNRNTTVMSYGADLYNASGTKLASKSVTLNENNFRATTKELSFTAGSGKDLNYSLAPDTTYQYSFWAVIDGYTFTSAKMTFKTLPLTYKLDLFNNYSGKNYMPHSDFTKASYSDSWQSRDTSTYTLSSGIQAINPSDPDSSHYNTYLKIKGTQAGSSGHDMSFISSTNASRAYNTFAGDTRPMVLSFWAKSSVAGAKFYIRWGYENVANYRSVALSTEWAHYTIPMDKSVNFGDTMHPYFDKAGTFYLAEVQLEDGTAPTSFSEDSSGIFTTVYAAPGDFYPLPVPQRAGYRFLGWYTQAVGGTPITDSTKAPSYHQRAYAHWERLPLPFKDVQPGDWYYDTVSDAYFGNIMTGYGDGTTFGPISPLTRAQFATILWRMENSPSAVYNGVFPDVVSAHWHAEAVAWANQAGIINGYSNGYFGPDDSITREQLAVMMYRYANYKKYSLALQTDLSSFSDIRSVNEFALTSMSWAAANGIISGKYNGTALDPQGNASRAEAATIIVRFISQFK